MAREVILNEFDHKYQKNPNLYLIWRYAVGNISSKGIKEAIALVCIHSSRALAERRLAQLNSNSFWAGDDFESPYIFRMEVSEIDHLFAATELGYDVEEDRMMDRMYNTEFTYTYYQHENDRIKTAARNKIEALESEIKDLKWKYKDGD